MQNTMMNEEKDIIYPLPNEANWAWSQGFKRLTDLVKSLASGYEGLNGSKRDFVVTRVFDVLVHEEGRNFYIFNKTSQRHEMIDADNIQTKNEFVTKVLMQKFRDAIRDSKPKEVAPLL